MGHHDLFEVDGVHVSRLEDMRLITGAGTFASDWSLPGQLHAFFLRADRAHAKILSIDTAAARRHPGVAGIYTGEDAVLSGYVRSATFLNFKGKNGMDGRIPERPVLAHGRVRFVGEPVALVVADSALAAQDAAESIQIEYEDLPVVIDPERALEPGAPLLHDSVPGNVPFEYEAGDKAAVEAAFAKAAHVTRLKMESTRVVPSPMEPRACLVGYEPKSESYTVHVCIQGMNMMKKQLSAYTKVAEEKLRVIARDVGGGFGQRSTAYAEYCAVMIAAKETGRAVKWVSSRTEGFLSDTHGRGNIIEGELALDKNGRFLGIRFNWLADMGGYLSPAGPVSHIRNPATCLTGVYDIPAAYGHWRLVVTNTAPIAAYRGAGRPDIAYAIERLVSNAAAETGIDAAELRRRNFIPPEAFPYKTPTGSTYDNADLPGVLRKALDLADWAGYPKRRTETEKRGKLRGRGIATVIENTGAGMFPKDEIELEVDAEGGVTAYSVSQSQGQGHETTFAMMVSKALEIPAERIRVKQCAPEKNLIGNHTGGSRTMVGAGTVCHIAAEKLVQHGKSLAAEELGLEPSQVSYADGAFSGPEQGMKLTLAELARRRPFSVKGEGTFGTTYPNGCHIAEVEIDPDTGVTDIASYMTVDDCGVVVNHAIVEGQMHGAVAQGAGQVFGEHAVYDRETGQLLTATFADYYMPRAGLLPDIRMAEHVTASRVNPLGIKGMGESGCTASLGALVNAVLDAVRPLGIHHLDMPLTSAKLWGAISAAKQ
ncbi:MAG: Carbon-monoxide dehydrogenase large subunit [Betaproteobacteria bacterium]|jgi:carbon-monoxide dehydrogenase large subunit|nr:Carbon-monoxide dehydrogenase large subunit [Betaproteobacteria bacterium]